MPTGSTIIPAAIPVVGEPAAPATLAAPAAPAALTTPTPDLPAALSATHDGVFVMNADRRFVFFNPALERMTGYTAGEVVGLRCACRDVAECRAETGRSLRGSLCPGLAAFAEAHSPGAPAALASSAPACARRCGVRRRSGEPLPAEPSYTVLRDPAGRIEMVIGVVRAADAADIPRRGGGTDRADPAALPRALAAVRERLASAYGFDTLISRSAIMEPVFRKVRAAAAGRSAVLIGGPSGTGKEVIARTIHAGGDRRDGPFVPLNCAALPRDLMESELFGHVQGSFTGASRDFPGLFRAAENGTIFLDEIADMPPETQAKLLRALQDRRVRPVGSVQEIPVNARVIAATNADLEEAVRTGRLRGDLYYRLSVISISVPPLSRRREDVPLLVQHFLESLNRAAGGQQQAQLQLHPAALAALGRYDWPGNVRELENAIESAAAVCTGGVIRPEDLPARVRGASDGGDGLDPAEGEAAADATAVDALGRSLDEIVADAERRAIRAALAAARGNRSQAADLLGIARSRLYRRIETLGITDV
jgi:transcriptional regulator with PAS, ATPase and Fis domain